tara:strand:+ start:13 stop:543 length:531 start_codon:yes stop_codon:yes gene_type:complete
MNQKYIITGAPGTGKTSIINELKRRQVHCIDENSREVIAEQIIIGGEILPWKNQIAFENQIANMRIQQYLASPDNCICFFDRSALDCIAYLKTNNLDASTEILSGIKNYVFNPHVFYTPIWEEIYTNDRERKESFEKAKAIENSLISTYRYFKYNLIKIPKLTIQERADFILSKIK